MDSQVLGITEAVRRRPFTSPDLYPADRAVLSYMLADLRAQLASATAIEAYETIEWVVHGRKRRTIVCDPQTLSLADVDVNVVGFFGERNEERDGTPLEEANAEIVLEFRNYPGILSYNSMELADGNWANLVLHDKPDTREYWRASRRHAEAAEKLSPLYYRTVRIHNGLLPGGLHGGEEIEIESTKYWDFSGPKVWRAARDLTAVTATSG